MKKHGDVSIFSTQATETIETSPFLHVSKQAEAAGTWALTPAHDLALTLHHAAGRRRQRLYLKGAFVKAQAHALSFALRRHELDGRTSAQELTLSGRWQADARNRLVFLVDKGRGVEDRLTFQGGWELGDGRELLYRYQQQLTPKRLTIRTLRFAGIWDLAGPNRLVYRLDASGDSAFGFRASLQTPSLNARDGRIAYQIGVELSRGRTVNRRVVLFGIWKLHDDLSVSFEIPYADGRREALRFQGTYAFGNRSSVGVELRDQRGAPLGIAVTFTRQFLQDASWFVRWQKAGKNLEALAGVQVRF